MFNYKWFILVVIIAAAINAQNINLHGNVLNKAAKPIAGAIVTLSGLGLKDTSGTDGSYAIVKNTSAVLPLLTPQKQIISIDNGYLRFSLQESSPVKIEFFDVNGHLLKKLSFKNASTGFYRFNISENIQAARLLVIRASIGPDHLTFRYLPMHNNYMVNSSTEKSINVNSKLAKMTVVNDTLKISAAGYTSKISAIESYDQLLNITLDTAASGSTGSIGCGKDLGSLKSGTYKITSASIDREYIIDIPANYDKNKPYRLVFGMHCMGSSATGVVSEKYYGLKPLADNAKIPCIFVAPQGYTDSSPWRVSDNKDHVFFSDMLKLFKGDLCVDTTRIFCCGFSYGAMVSYSLSTAFQKQLRAVACYAPANWNIYLPTNTHEPIAYYQTTGTSDNLCKWVNSDASKQGGKYCVLQHIEDNGGPAPATIPTATGNKHVSTLFPGTKEGYPVKFGSFQGGHQCTSSDAGSSENWIAKETWEFFMQF